MAEELQTIDYPAFLAQLKGRIRQRQYAALRAVNLELVGLYLEIGQAIHEKQEAQGWGKSVVETLARDLQAEFPGRNGFSARNLWNMLDLSRAYIGQPKLQPLVAEISWAKNLVILARVKDPLEREFYLRATARCGWTKAKYALRNATRPLGIATYTVVPQLPQDYQADLPSPEAIADRIGKWQNSDPE